MRLLLDTHIFLALLDQGSVALSPIIRKIVADTETELFVSVATLWEVAIKLHSGKLVLSMAIAELPARSAALGIAVIAIEPHHVLIVVTPKPATRDPFDRLLLAQAHCEDMRLLTIDRALVEHPLAWLAPAK